MHRHAGMCSQTHICCLVVTLCYACIICRVACVWCSLQGSVEAQVGADAEEDE